MEVFNAVGSGSLAAETGSALAADGLKVATEADTTVVAKPSETLVRYAPGDQAQAVAVMDDFAGAVTMQADPHIPPGAVAVDVGTSETVIGQPGTATGPSATTNPTPTTAASPPTTVPTIAGAAPSSSTNQLTPYDPRPC